MRIQSKSEQKCHHELGFPLEKWIGLAHVKPKPGNDVLGGAAGAYVAAVALAGDPDDFGKFVVGHKQCH